jgi:pimeloyl-ACP methyl ester carboxylesterase
MTQVIAEEMRIVSEPGIDIYVRNKYSSEMNAFRPERTLLFVHGATYPAHTSFDLPLGGMSWMDYIASHGYDTYLLDLRGYGNSTRPKEMNEKPEANPPIVRGETALKDISAVVGAILKRRSVMRLNLLGWSWGATLAPAYSIQYPTKVERLVLYGPPWIRDPPTQASSSLLPAYRMVRRDEVPAYWLRGVPEDKAAALIPVGWFETWAEATWGTDSIGAAMRPPVLRAPNGVLADGADSYDVGKPYYDPAKITAPTLLIQAEWDQETPPYMAQTLFPLLKNAPDKRYVLLGEGTHRIMMERNRLKLFEEVQAFLNEGLHR